LQVLNKKLKIGSFVIPKIVGVMLKNEPCYVVTKIKKDLITIEQNIGCYKHILIINKNKLEVL